MSYYVTILMSYYGIVVKCVGWKCLTLTGLDWRSSGGTSGAVAYKFVVLP